MKEIKMIAKFIRDELDDAECYAKKATMYKESDARLADMFYTLSKDELSHAEAEHEQAVRLIKEQDNEAPESMKAVWEWEHELLIDRTADIKKLLEMYKE